MKNNKKQDSLSVNVIASQNDIEAVSKGPVGNAGKDPFCVYAHQRHAVGSRITNQDGSDMVCKEEGTWQKT